MNLRTMRRRFREPPAIHAPWLGWAWNGALDDDRLEQQIDAVVRAGFGGVAIYPHDGLLHGIHSSPGWFEHVAAVARRIRRTTVSIHLRESLEGPFAAVEEQLCHDHPEACLTELTVEETGSEPADLSDALAAYAVDRVAPAPAHRVATSGALTEPYRVTRIEGATTDAPMLVFRTRKIPNRLNYLDRRAAELFLQTVPQHLATHAKRALGRSVTGLFIDGIGLRLTPGALPWDPEIDTLFRETRGYSLIDALPALFYDLPEFERVRYDYWTIINDMLREGLATPIKEWCEEHRLRFGVSLRPLDRRDPALLETALLPVERTSDDFVLRIPYDVAERGFRNPAAFADWLVALKRICSNCEQHGAPMQAAVSIGCESPELDFERASALGMWLMCLGAQTVIFERLAYRPDPHAAEFSLNDEEPYWSVLQTLNATLARVSGLMRQGRGHTDIAVLYPSASVQAIYAHPLRASDAPQALSPDRLIFRHLAHLSVALCEAGADFHMLQERTLLELGHAEHRRLGVGDYRYRVVIVPPGVNMCRQTVELLHDFVSGGGTLALAGSVPYLVEGRESEALGRLVDEYGLLLPNRSDLFDYRPVVEFLRRRRFIPTSEDGDAAAVPMVCRRTDEEADVALAFNPRTESRTLRLQTVAPFDGHVEYWDPRTGEMRGVAPCTANEAVVVSDNWEPYEARIYVAVETAFREADRDARVQRAEGPVPIWSVTRTEPNALEFSHCHLSGDTDDDQSTIEDVRMSLVDAIADAGRPVVWRSVWRFHVSGEKEASGCTLLVPAPDAPEESKPEVLFDRDALSEPKRQSYRGCEFLAYACPPLSAGMHEIDWTSGYRVASDFRSPVLLGDIATRQNGHDFPTIAAASRQLDFGAWSDLGLTYYRGPVVYRGTWTVLDLTKGERVVLCARGVTGAAAVRVNGNYAGALLYHPAECDITRFVKRAENVIEIALSPEPGTSGDVPALVAPPVLYIDQTGSDREA